MRYLSIIILLLNVMNAFGQARSFSDIPTEILIQFDKMGCEKSSILNSYEVAYFNVFFKDSSKKIDFSGKKVGFIYHGARSNKVEYFDLEKDRYSRKYTPNNCKLYIFDETQKKESGGYDAAIVYWNKIDLPIGKVIKILRKPG